MPETIEGKIRRIIWHGVGKGSRSGRKFLIAELDNGRTVKGEMSRPTYGVPYRFLGELRYDKRSGEDVFFFDVHDELVEQNESGVAQYLARNVDGLGRVKARALVDAFGVDCLRTLQAKPELACQVKALNKSDVESLIRWFKTNRRLDPVAVSSLLEMFAGQRFPKKLAEQLVTDFGSDAPAIVREQPYLLLSYPRMGWVSVDPFALSLGYDPAGPERHKAAIVEAFERHCTEEGHTYATRYEVDTIAFSLLGTRPSPPAWAALVNEGVIVSYELEARGRSDARTEDLGPVVEGILKNEQSRYGLPRVASAESYVATRLAELAARGRPIPFEPCTEGLNDEQQSAVRMFHESPVCMLLGAPGTGKSYTISRFLRSLVEHGYLKVRFVAPTGKAAKRGDELISQALEGGCASVPCSTVHRALEPTPSDAPLGVPDESAKIGRGRESFYFGRCESRPFDLDLLIVDETSMLDVILTSSLVSAIANGTRVVFVGDTNQLPSVGPGSVLRDLKDSGQIPFVELTRIVRSDGGGRVVRACHAIKDGVVPEPGESISLPSENWVHVDRPDLTEAGEEIVRIYESIRNNGNFDPYWGVQVISPQTKTNGIGCNALNDRLSALLNPRESAPEDNGRYESFRVGDKVVRTKNGIVDGLTSFMSFQDQVDWRWRDQKWVIVETDVVNGDMGTVEDVVQDNRAYVVVRFRNPERLCRLPYSEPHLQQAFAMTVHKAQGSGFPVVIVPVSLKFHWNPVTNTGLNSLENFYTAISRTEQILLTVGPWAAVEAVVRRRTIGHRRTLLAGRLKEMFEKPANGYQFGEVVGIDVKAENRDEILW